jgi:RimJ/RimL family protein N-acetyltransferase
MKSIHKASWKPKEVLGRAREVLKKEGIKSLWFKTIGEICYRRAYLYQAWIDSLLTHPTTVDALAISPLTSKQLPIFIDFQPDVSIQEAEARLHKGHLAFVVWVDESPVHISWASPEKAEMGYLFYTLVLPSDAVYIYNAYTKPEYRGRHLSSARFRWSLPYLQNLGFQRLIAIAMPENQPAINAIQRSGYEPIGIIRTWFMGQHTHTRVRLQSGIHWKGAV